MRGIAGKALAGTVLALLLAAAPATALPRSSVNRPDDAGAAKQIQVVYALPSDGAGLDRGLDANGQLDTEAAVFNRWFTSQTGQALRLDTAGGSIDTLFLALPQTSAQINAGIRGIGYTISQELARRGLTQPNKAYLVYYDGQVPTRGFCGVTGGSAGVVFLRDNQTQECGQPTLAANAASPDGLLQHTAVHEILHAIGFVPSCAPHDYEQHVTDDPNDLMNGTVSSRTPVIDTARDDYFGARVPGCPELATSGWIGPVSAASYEYARRLSGSVLEPKRFDLEVLRPKVKRRARTVKRGKRFTILLRVSSQASRVGACELRKGRKVPATIIKRGRPVVYKKGRKRYLGCRFTYRAPKRRTRLRFIVGYTLEGALDRRIFYVKVR